MLLLRQAQLQLPGSAVRAVVMALGSPASLGSPSPLLSPSQLAQTDQQSHVQHDHHIHSLHTGTPRTGSPWSRQPYLPPLTAVGTHPLHTASPTHAAFGRRGTTKEQWEALLKRVPQDEINPCQSPLHPAVKEGLIAAPTGEEMPVQDAYTPASTCFGCGASNPEGLQLKSRRIENGLEAVVTIPAKFCAFPGIVNGGIVSTLLECHGNWTAAIALMDKACLPRPPLTLTASMLVTYKEPTPPDVPLLLRSQVVALKESQQPSIGKASVEVETSVYLITNSSLHSRVIEGLHVSEEPGEAHLQLLAVSHGVHKRMGALRAL